MWDIEPYPLPSAEMTLIVSLRIPDGIVIAGDSLSTSLAQVQIQGEVNVECPECRHQHTVGPAPLAQVSIPASTFSFAQKVFPMLDRYGVGTYGLGQLAGRTIYFAMRELERELTTANEAIETVTQMAERVGTRAHDLLLRTMPDLERAADDWVALGFQVVGYDDTTAKTKTVRVGKQLTIAESTGFGCTRSGEARVVDAIWGLYKQHAEDQAAYEAFSLQDAIAYAEFLIATTASYQQFAKRIPSVGGKIDIALVTPFDGFRWIRQKELGEILEGRRQ
jgi:hypothetical protein